MEDEMKNWNPDADPGPGEDGFDDDARANLRDIARQLYADGSDNDIEIDDEPQLSRSDNGTWVQAWVYVSDEEMPVRCSKCGVVEGSPAWGTVGDGFNGMCPLCADKEETASVS